MIAATEAPSTRRQLAFFPGEMKESLSRIEKSVLIRKKNKAARNERIRTRFNELYNVERKRIDDAIDTLCEEFSLAKSTIESALRG